MKNRTLENLEKGCHAERSRSIQGGAKRFFATLRMTGFFRNCQNSAKIIFGFNLLLTSLVFSAEAPFSRGVNLTSWFQASSPRQIQFSKFTKQDFIQIQSLGCDVIRLPINLHTMTDGAPDYTLDPLFLYFLDQVVDWAEELHIHLILDNHTFDPAVDTDPDIGDVLVKVWAQMAAHYRDRSTTIYYEILNEPHGISDVEWNNIQKTVIDTIRTIDQKHTLVVGPASWNSYNNLDAMSGYTDDNLIYTFHFYDPFMFTHQGASWTDPSMAPLAGVPFPYDAAEMPGCPSELKGTWIESSLNGYKTDGTVEKVRELLDIAVQFKEEQDVPLFCGEFGVYMPNSDPTDRVYWYNIVRSYLEENGIAWTIWDYTGSFGLFEATSNELFDYDLNVPLIEALGLTVPEQKEFVLRPDSTAFDLYTDYFGPQMLESSWTSSGTLDYYDETDPASGQFCMYWTEVPQYNHIGFDFKPDKDLSRLVQEGYAIDFWIKCNAPGSQIDMRFIDTKTTDADDHPWRMRYTLDQTAGQWDGAWHHLQIPLEDFEEHGSWDDDAWFNPQGDFDWTDVDRFEFVSEHHDLTGIRFWLDQIRVVDPALVRVDNLEKYPGTFRLDQNYPNPFNPETRITYTIPNATHVVIAVWNVQGRQVAVPKECREEAGAHSLIFNGNDLPSGVYTFRIQADEFVQSRKMLLLK